MTHFDELSRSALIRLLEQHQAALDEAGEDGIILAYTGRTAPWQIVREVKPKLSRISKRLSCGDEKTQCDNEIWDGENLSAMVTLYKYRGQVDLILTDPPYNTGEDFRYNDRWDRDPNDPDLGDLVPKEDGSRHSKWLRFMTPRLWMMREMLRPGGVIAICIDHRELFRLGMLMDEIFKEENLIGIINWQKSYSPRNDNIHVSTATEYVLVYAKNADRAKTSMIARTDEMNARYSNPDNDPEGDWTSGDASGPGAATHRKMVYGVQHPFTGEIVYPSEGCCWRSEKKNMKAWLDAWGSEYEEKWIDDDNEFLDEKTQKRVRIKALVLKGARFVAGRPNGPKTVLENARKAALLKLKAGAWPRLYFTSNGEGGQRLKRYLKDVKKGKVPMTYWADEEYDSPVVIESQSWDHEQSGHSQAGITELDAVVGKGHKFKTAKPLRLFKKIIQLWCRPTGLVLDPFAGSGTTGQAILELNRDASASRKFILIEQGNTEAGDHYAKTLTADRVSRVIRGDWASGQHPPAPGGFRFMTLQKQGIDESAVIALAREEMIDLLLTSYWDRSEKALSSLERVPVGAYKHLFAEKKAEGFFLVWESPDRGSVLDRATFREIVAEAKAAGLSAKYHVYASSAPYTGSSVEFYKIPERVLEHIGFSTRSDSFNNEPADVVQLEDALLV
jgi:adenine-specific DNA-methyltransferase